MRRITVQILILCATFSAAFSQGEIPVDLYTGTPSISIPLGSISAIDVSQPITLSYDANSAGNNSVCGSGWRLQFSGMITREVRGLPDDISLDDPLDRLGWLRTNSSDVLVATAINFVPQSDTSASTYSSGGVSGELYDYNKLDGYNDKIDTEPDIFIFNFNGLSGKFVFDNTGIIRTIPYMDIKVSSITSNSVFRGFTITTNDGYKYTFTNIRGGIKYIIKNFDWSAVHILSTQYLLYQQPVKFATHWALTEMRSPSGNTITYNYGSLEDISLNDSNEEEVSIAMYHDDGAPPQNSYPYEAQSIYTNRHPPAQADMILPNKIESSTGEWLEFVFNGSSGMIEKINFQDNRKGLDAAGFVKSFEFSYMEVNYQNSDGLSAGGLRNFLKTLRETSGCERQRPYTFGYSINTRTDFSPEFFVTVSYWPLSVALFYSNLNVTIDDVKYPALHIYPNEPMKERYRLKPITNYSGTVYSQGGGDKGTGTVLGALNLIEYPSGGRTGFQFEQNRYYDFKESDVKFAPGTRIGSIWYNDGTGATAIENTFSYIDDNGKSTGRIFRKPIYHLPAYKWQDPANLNDNSATYSKSYSSLSTTEDRWNRLTLRTEWDIAPNDADNAVGYTRVKVYRNDAGWAIHEFHVPAVYGETSNGSWKTPETLIARQSSSINMANTIFPSGGTYRFPNAPNPFYDYARGLPKKVSNYSQSGQLVKKVVTTYRDLYKKGLSQPAKVYALRYERMPLSERNETGNRIYLFSRYFLLTDATKVPETETVTLYDASDTTKRVSETTQYFYSSTKHKLLTEVKRTTPDGTIYRSKFKYPRDYTNQSTGEGTVVALKNLSDTATYFMNGSPVETVMTLQKSGGSEYITGASVVKYNSFAGKPMPESNWTLELDALLATGSFTNSSVANVSGYKFVIDTRYKKVSGIESYNSTGIPTRFMSPVTRDTTETAYGFSNSLPVVKAVNAASNQAVFSDFDNFNDFNFNYTTAYLSGGRSGKNAFYPYSTLYKNDLRRVDVKNYILSFWLKSNTTINFQVNIKKNVAPYSTTYATRSFSVSSTGSEFNYVRKIISFDSIASNVKIFRVEFKSTTSLSTPGSTGYTSGLLPVIDDVFFFPEGAHMESYDYQVPYGVSMVTTGTGNASHITYDGLGREKYVRDRDMNIVKRNTYSQIDDNPLFADFTVPSMVHVNEAISFQASLPTCMDSLTFEWDFGEGFVTGESLATHTFSTIGGKLIKLRISAPGYGSQTKSKEVFINPEPIVGTLCARGLSEFNATAATYTNGYTCTDISVQPATWRTTFKVTNLTGCDDGCSSYTWYIRDQGVLNYTPVQFGGTEFTCAKVVTNTKTFEVICKATAIDGRQGWIGPLPVVITHP